MVRIALIVFVLIFIVIGVGVFFGVRAVRNWNAERAEEAASTSTEARSSWKGFFGILRKDYLSKEPFERKDSDSGFQLKWPWGGGDTSGGSRGDQQEGGDTGFVLRRDAASGSSAGPSSQRAISRPSPRPSQIPYGFTPENLSSFFGEVTMTSFQPSRRSDYDRTSISFMADIRISQPINVTGWKIRMNSGEVTIPQAIERYVPGSSVAGDILLGPGHTLFLFGHYKFAAYKHPFGKSIRLNQCTGYLNSVYEFDPKLPERCPKVQKEELLSLSGACQTFLSQFGNCRVPTPTEINFFSGDAACQTFMRTKFGYGLCYNSRKDSENFFSNQWYAWLQPQGQIPLARDHDRVLLFDRTGLLVDEFAY